MFVLTACIVICWELLGLQERAFYFKVPIEPADLLDLDGMYMHSPFVFGNDISTHTHTHAQKHMQPSSEHVTFQMFHFLRVVYLRGPP